MKLRCKNTIKLSLTDSDRGSSSVLVIMVMLLLITFGVLAMMSSYSNLKIAQKNAQWTSDFYALESVAELDMLTFKSLYNEAQNQSNAIFKNGTIDSNAIQSIPDPEQSEITKAYQSISGDDKEKLSRFQNQVFLYLFYDGFENSVFKEMDMTSNFDKTILSSEVKEDWIPEVAFISSDAKTNRNLLVKVAFKTLNSKNGYEIVDWREVPENFEYDNMLEFEDPEGN